MYLKINEEEPMSEILGYALLTTLKMLDMEYEDLLKQVPYITVKFENLSHKESGMLLKHNTLLLNNVRNRKKVTDADRVEINEKLTHILSNTLEKSI